MRIRDIPSDYRFFAPEIVQTSNMDCGPASLKCLLEGCGIPVSYARLRDACQTDVDGTSIDTMEEVAVQLGLEAEQVMVPVDHLVLPEANCLPALVVTALPNGITHFVVVWRRLGRFLQVMDPASGRKWVDHRRFVKDLYVHQMAVPAEAWREWAGSNEFLDPLRGRMKQLRFREQVIESLLAQPLSHAEWRPLATVDAAVRMVAALVDGGGVRRGKEAERLTQGIIDSFSAEETDSWEIPEPYWNVRPAEMGDNEEEHLILRGAVLVRILGKKRKQTDTAGEQDSVDSEEEADQLPPELSPELAAALEEPPARPLTELGRMLRVEGIFQPSVILFALFLAACGVIIEALFFRGFFDLGAELGLIEQRLGGMGIMIIFLLLLLLLELPIANGVLGMGRRLEARLRMAFLEKIPRLGDRYFRSRLTSDMAERSHSIYQVRFLPDFGARLVRAVFELLLTTVGIIWLAPASAGKALLLVCCSVGVPLLGLPVLAERDLKVRTHGGALARFYLDGLLGLVALRAHGGERALRREHQTMLKEWRSAGFSLLGAAISVEGWQTLLGFSIAAWLLCDHLWYGGEIGTVLLLTYWVLNLPILGQELGTLIQKFPVYRNITLRMLEPLGAREESPGEEEDVSPETSQAPASSSGVEIVLRDVEVQAAGHSILRGINLLVTPGEQVAIVGSSGAGKTSLVGLLMGWHKPGQGEFLVDGEPCHGTRLDQLRRLTAWVDPAVRLWNRSLFDNLIYGASEHPDRLLGECIEAADLRALMLNLPDALQTPLGEGGALVSGGEGQRVRLGRAMLRKDARLVILDEPFRGLDRETRSRLLSRAREWWQGATLLCITHDIAETRAFERVLVIEQGQIAEDGSPEKLMEDESSRYGALVRAEEMVRRGLWESSDWRKCLLDRGKVLELSDGEAGR